MRLSWCSCHLQTTELPAHATVTELQLCELQIRASDHYSYFDGKLERVINGVTSVETEQDGCLSLQDPKRRWKHISAELKLCFGVRVSH